LNSEKRGKKGRSIHNYPQAEGERGRERTLPFLGERKRRGKDRGRPHTVRGGKGEERRVCTCTILSLIIRWEEKKQERKKSFIASPAGRKKGRERREKRERGLVFSLIQEEGERERG